MTFWLTAGMLAVTFGSRYAGLALQTDPPSTSGCGSSTSSRSRCSPRCHSLLEGGFGEGEIRAAGAGVATIVAWRPATPGSQSPPECSPSALRLVT